MQCSVRLICSDIVDKMPRQLGKYGFTAHLETMRKIKTLLTDFQAGYVLGKKKRSRNNQTILQIRLLKIGKSYAVLADI